MQDVFPIPLAEAVILPLEPIPAPQPGMSIEYIDPEFSAVCPKTGLPDFGRIIIQYQPDKFVPELKALKLYLRSFYGVGIMHEPVTIRIARDLVACIAPKRLQVIGDWGARGGVKTVTGIAYDEHSGWLDTPMFDQGPFAQAAAAWTNE